MSTYELTFLLENEAEAKNLTDIITSFEGRVIDEKKWGAIQLAYPIKKQTSAHYITWNIEVDKKNVPGLKQKLNFHEKLLRYLLLDKSGN